MGLFDGKKGLILGVANDRSIAWAIAKKIMEEGGECGFTHLPDRPDDERRKNYRRVTKCTDGYDNAKFIIPMDVQDDDNIAEVMVHGASLLKAIVQSGRWSNVAERVFHISSLDSSGEAMAINVSAASRLFSSAMASVSAVAITRWNDSSSPAAL